MVLTKRRAAPGDENALLTSSGHNQAAMICVMAGTAKDCNEVSEDVARFICLYFFVKKTSLLLAPAERLFCLYIQGIANEYAIRVCG